MSDPQVDQLHELIKDLSDDEIAEIMDDLADQVESIEDE